MFNLAQAKMIESQQEQKKQANWYKKEALKLVEGDKV